MHYSPLLVLHIGAGISSLLAGAAALSFRKGSHWHGVSGNIFFVSMLTMSSAGVYMASMKSEMSNVFGGTLTFYMVATGWMTARRRTPGTGIFDRVALLLALVLGAVIVTFGVEAARSPAGTKDGIPAGIYFFLGSIALLSAAGDIRMLLRGGISGTKRLVRHLWRMCFGLYIASASLFLARPHLFPAILRKTYVITLLGVLPLILMIFWLIRVRLKPPATRRKSPGPSPRLSPPIPNAQPLK